MQLNFQPVIITNDLLHITNEAVGRRWFQGNFQVPLCLCVKTSLRKKPFTWKYFHPKGFSRGLVLKQRRKVTWKWPIMTESRASVARVSVGFRSKEFLREKWRVRAPFSAKAIGQNTCQNSVPRCLFPRKPRRNQMFTTQARKKVDKSVFYNYNKTSLAWAVCFPIVDHVIFSGDFFFYPS